VVCSNKDSHLAPFLMLRLATLIKTPACDRAMYTGPGNGKDLQPGGHMGRITTGHTTFLNRDTMVWNSNHIERCHMYSSDVTHDAVVCLLWYHTVRHLVTVETEDWNLLLDTTQTIAYHHNYLQNVQHSTCNTIVCRQKIWKKKLTNFN